jgi:penicillin-binding protein 2
MSRIGWEDPPQAQESQEQIVATGRLYFLRAVVAIVLFGLLLRVYHLQQTRGDELQAMARENQFARLWINPPRGVILDRHGRPLAVNVPSFNVTITPAFLPRDSDERQAVFERLSLLTGVPVTNTVEQQALRDAADRELVSAYSRMAELYGAPVAATLDQANVVPLLPDSIAGIVQTYSFDPYNPHVVKANITAEEAYTIAQESLFLPGVRVLTEPIRQYPSGEYTAHLIGYMGPIPNEGWLERGYQRDDRVGWSGLEIFMERELFGIKGQRHIEVDWTGREVRQIGLAQEPVAGYNLNLTLDLELQEHVHEILLRIMDLRRNTRDSFTGNFEETEQGVVVVLNPNTGEVLAMVSIPTFDNNRFATEVPVEYYLGLARDDYRPLVNNAVAGQYPPGSVFKLVTAAGALQEGVVSPNRYLNDPGSITIANRFAPNDPGRAQTFYCWLREGHGLINMWLGLAVSCNVYFYKLTGGFNQDGEFVEGLGIDKLAEYARQFGFGRLQGIESYLEAPGNMPTEQWKRQVHGEPWSTGDDYNAGVGQGFVTSTPLQLAQMAAIIANGGFLYRPTLIHHITDENGNVVRPFEPEVLNAVNVDRQYIDIIAEGMRMVNQEGGTGASLNNFEWLDVYGIATAGKTGTAEFCDLIAIKREWCRPDDRQGIIRPTHSWFVGYAPYEKPEIAVVGFIFNGGEGSTWAAPLVREVMAAYFKVGRYAPEEDEPGAQTSNLQP